jgi:thiamine monophosphate synthase
MSDFTQADLDAIKKAIALGATRVQYRDRTVDYRTLDELLRVRRTIENAIAGAPVPGERVMRVTFDKGYQS